MLRAHDLWKSYGRTEALRGVSLSVERGRITALLGPNGAGKTTLVSTVVGLLSPDSGTITMDGEDISTQRRGDLARLIGFAPQALGIYPGATVRENLTYLGRLAGLRTRELSRAADEVAAALGLDALMDRFGRELSGGEKRRLHTALALVHRPTFALLDEPTVGADYESRHRLLDFVRDLVRRGGAVLYTTHHLDEVERLEADVAILDEGRLIMSGSLHGLIARHGSSYLDCAFAGPAPELGDGFEAELVSDEVIRITTDDVARTLARVMSRLGDRAGRISSIEVVRPSLESAVLQLTGRRYDRNADGGGAA